jgi:photosystem II stability/assembly factor-like uncharacterized protein
LKTTDGGQKWTDIDIPGVFERLNSVFFVDENRGWITGMGGPLLATEDGGKTWKKMADPGRGWYQGVVFDAKGHGYLAGDAVMTSDDWGKTWKLVPGEMSAWRILLAGSTVWAVGPFEIHVSRDGQKFVEKEPFPASDRLGASDHTGDGF